MAGTKEGESLTRCIYCGSNKTATTDSRHRPRDQWRRRRKKCMSCHRLWTTYEVPADLLIGLTDARKLVLTTQRYLTALQVTLNKVPTMEQGDRDE